MPSVTWDSDIPEARGQRVAWFTDRPRSVSPRAYGAGRRAGTRPGRQLAAHPNPRREPVLAPR
jgi:hypothetical protein